MANLFHARDAAHAIHNVVRRHPFRFVDNDDSIHQTTVTGSGKKPAKDLPRPFDLGSPNLPTQIGLRPGEYLPPSTHRFLFKRARSTARVMLEGKL